VIGTLRPAALSAVAIWLCLVSAFPATALDLYVSSARLDHDVRSGRPTVKVTLNEQSRRDFASFSVENIGRKIELQIDGKTVLAPIIREPITGGVLELSGGEGWTDEAAWNIAGLLSQAGAKIEAVAAK
jgi:preprotein translocase subunit SecD